MSYRIIHGVYRLLWQDARTGEDHGSRPDGDSVWFEPDDPLLLGDLGGVDAKLNGGGCAQLRLEAIDALELHHAGAHQRRPECERARSFLIKRLGFRSLFAPGNGVPSLVRVARPDAPRGFIATRGCDSPRTRRPVAFAFVGRRRGRRRGPRAPRCR